MAKDIGDVIYNLLSNDSAVSAIVGTKIKPFISIEDVASPYIVYDIIGLEPTDTKDGVSDLDTVEFDVEMYTKTPQKLKDLNIKVRNVLDRHSGTTETIKIQSITYLGEDGDYSDDERVYIKIQNYKARIDKS